MLVTSVGVILINNNSAFITTTVPCSSKEMEVAKMPNTYQHKLSKNIPNKFPGLTYIIPLCTTLPVVMKQNGYLSKLLRSSLFFVGLQHSNILYGFWYRCNRKRYPERCTGANTPGNPLKSSSNGEPYWRQGEPSHSVIQYTYLLQPIQPLPCWLVDYQSSQ